MVEQTGIQVGTPVRTLPLLRTSRYLLMSVVLSTTGTRRYKRDHTFDNKIVGRVKSACGGDHLMNLLRLLALEDEVSAHDFLVFDAKVPLHFSVLPKHCLETHDLQ